MGNQQGKQGAKRAAQTYPFDEPEKKSRTDWTAGKTPSTSPLPVANPSMSLASLEPFPNPVQWLCTRPQIAVRPLCLLRVFPPSTITDLAPQVQTGNPGMSDRTVQGKHVHQ